MKIIYAILNFTVLISSQLELNYSIYREMQEWASFANNPYFVEYSRTAVIPCLIGKNDKRLRENPLKESHWLDFLSLPIIGDRINASDDFLVLKHAQHEDTRKMFCQLTSGNRFEHYVIVYDIPDIRLVYRLIYKIPMCLEELIQQKAINIDHLVKHNPVTLHHGLIYRVGKTSCYYSDDYATALTTITIFCEDGDKKFRKTCKTLECYFFKTKEKLLEASIDSAKRWREIESDPTKYPEILKTYVRMPEFKLEPEVVKPTFVNLCPDKYFLLKNVLCLPCASGRMYDNVTFKCIDCPRNSYQPFDLAEECFPCPSNGETNLPAASDVRFCHAVKSEGLKFIQANAKFLVLVVVAVLITLGSIYIKAKSLNERKFVTRKDDETSIRKPFPNRLASVDYFSPTKTIRHATKEDFLLEAGEKRKKLKPKFIYYSFDL